MTRTVAVVCGAGVSSTFLARGLRRLLAERGLDWSVEPLAVDQLAGSAERLDHVVVGRHLAETAGEIAASLAARGVRTTLLTTPGSGDDAAREALDHLTAALADPSGGHLG